MENFKIISSEKNNKAGIEFETKATIKCQERRDVNEVWIDLFDDVYTETTSEIKVFIQAKNFKKMSSSQLIKATKTLFYNYLVIDTKSINYSQILYTDDYDMRNHKYVLFIKTLSQITEQNNIMVNKMFGMCNLSPEFQNNLTEFYYAMFNDEKNQFNAWLIEMKEVYPSFVTQFEVMNKDLIKKLVNNFINNSYIYICDKQNFEYAPDFIQDESTRDEVFNEIKKSIQEKKSGKEIDSTEKLSLEQFKKKYSTRMFTKREYKELIYKRLLGENFLKKNFAISYPVTKMLPEKIQSDIYEEIEDIVIEVYDQLLDNSILVNEMINIIISLHDETENKNLFADALNKCNKIKNINIITENTKKYIIVCIIDSIWSVNENY